jgi:glycosyltransferase involved in cell wall biosynthesis
VLTVLQIIPNLGAGGAEQTCAPIAAGLVARGDRALVVTTGGVHGDDVTRVGGVVIEHDVKTKNPAKIIANAVWLARLIRAQKVDIVHARSRAPAWSAYLACRMTGAVYVTTFHAAYRFSNPAKRAYNAVMAKGARVIAISAYLARHVREAYGLGPTLRIVPRGIDLDQFDPAHVPEARRAALRELWGLAPSTRILFCPARLTPIKGHATVIDAMALLSEAERKDLCLVIAGDPQGREAYREALGARVADRGLNDYVKIVPHCHDMAAGYSLATLALVPSIVPEGFGRVPVEAMAMGVPVIASDLGPLPETVANGVTGWLARVSDVGAWAEALRRALGQSAEDARRMALAGRARVESQFTTQKMVAATLAVYDEVAPR